MSESRRDLSFRLFKLPSIGHYKEKGKLESKIDEYIAHPSRRLDTDPTRETGHSLNDYTNVWNRASHPNHLLVLSDAVLDQIRKNMTKTSGIFVISINHMTYNIVVPSRTRVGNIAQYKRHLEDPSLVTERSISAERTASLEAHEIESDVRPEDPSRPYLVIVNKLGFFDKGNKWHKRPPKGVTGLSLEGGTQRKYRQQIGMGCACANRQPPANTMFGGKRRKRVTKKHKRSRRNVSRRR